MEGVAAAREAGDLAVDVRAALHRALELLQDQHGAALAHDEAVAIAVERARRLLGLVVAPRRRLDRVEAGHRDGRDARLGRAGDDDVGLAVLDQLVAVADRVDPGRAAGRDDRARALRAELQRHLARQAARDEGLVEERARVLRVDEPLLALVGDGDVVVLEVHRPADRRAQRDAHPLAVDATRDRARCRASPPSPRDGELDVAVHAADLLVVEPRLDGVEVALGGDLRAEARRIEERDLAASPSGRR